MPFHVLDSSTPLCLVCTSHSMLACCSSLPRLCFAVVARQSPSLGTTRFLTVDMLPHLRPLLHFSPFRPSRCVTVALGDTTSSPCRETHANIFGLTSTPRFPIPLQQRGRRSSRATTALFHITRSPSRVFSSIPIALSEVRPFSVRAFAYCRCRTYHLLAFARAFPRTHAVLGGCAAQR